jgi:hypothetical protein
LTTVIIVFFSTVSIGIIVTVATLPWWFTRSLYQHRLWRMRDRLADDILDRNLPPAHPAVVQLFRRTTSALRNGRRMTMLDVVIGLIMRRHAEEQVSLLETHRDELETLLAGSTITGSWLGMAFVAVWFIPALAHYLREQREKRLSPGLVISASEATDIAVRRTHLVQPSQALYREHEAKNRKANDVVASPA